MNDTRPRAIFIFKSGRLSRYQNTIRFTFSENGSKNNRILPINSIESLHCLGQVKLNSAFLSFAGKKSVSIHFYDWHGNYVGSFVPVKRNISGFLLVKQVQAYLDHTKRMSIAREIVRSLLYNMRKNIKYFSNRNVELSEVEASLDYILLKLDTASSVQEIMGLEGEAWQCYYGSWDSIIQLPDFKFEARSRRPPLNRLNSLISFGNTLLYSEVVKQINLTALHPAVSFLHEPFERRLSLALDIAEMFKPVLVDRLIIHMIKSKEIDSDDFLKAPTRVILKESARKKFIERFMRKLDETVKHRKLKRNVSYRTMIRLECYKLTKFLIEENEYEGFRMWWV